MMLPLSSLVRVHKGDYLDCIICDKKNISRLDKHMADVHPNVEVSQYFLLAI